MNTNAQKWLRSAGIRAGKAIAQTAVTMIGTAMLLSDVNWKAVFSASVLAGILSLLKSMEEFFGNETQVQASKTETTKTEDKAKKSQKLCAEKNGKNLFCRFLYGTQRKSEEKTVIKRDTYLKITRKTTEIKKKRKRLVCRGIDNKR